MKSDGDVSFHSSHVLLSFLAPFAHGCMLLPELQFTFLEQTAQTKWNSQWAEFQSCILTN